MPGPSGSRLAVYLELPYRHDAGGYSVDRAFMLFVLELRHHVERLDLIGRVDPESGRATYPIPPEVVVVALPHYHSLRDLVGLVAALPAALGVIWRAAGDVDVVWSIGPHPMSVPVAVLARLRGCRVVLGVRQNFPEYVRHRLPSARWRPALAAAAALEATFRVLARWMPVVAVGDDLAARYRRAGADVYQLEVTLVRTGDLASGVRAELDPGRLVELLSVGRLDPEKAPGLLLDMLERLRARGKRRYRLTIVGTGLLEDELRMRAASMGAAVRMLGYVAFGPELLELYRRSDVFVHVARTEGLPQVLVEAQSQGIPIVATAVGGVPAAVDHGAAAVLVPPGDAAALADAVQRIADDAALRARYAQAGLDMARSRTLESAAAATVRFLDGGRR